jgi:hypothetical protein
MKRDEIILQFSFSPRVLIAATGEIFLFHKKRLAGNPANLSSLALQLDKIKLSKKAR